MSDERPEGRLDDASAESSPRPPPRNPFADADEPDAGDGIPALIQGRKNAAFYGVLFGLIMLVLVVGICVMASYAFG